MDADVVEAIKEMLDEHNPLTKAFRMARDRFDSNEYKDVKLKLIDRRGKDGRRYNLTTASEVAALIVGDIDNSFDKRDIILETQSGSLRRISELHPSYLPLQYPLSFSYGEYGYTVDIPYTENTSTRKRTRLSMREFFSYRIQERINEASTIRCSRKFFQQFLVDAYTMIEAERLSYIRANQKKLRSETYNNLRAYAQGGNNSALSTGKRIILPSSFTGEARYMVQNYLDAMALCKWYGYPDLFITFTCNPKWPVTRFVTERGLKPEDRPDILCRVFKIKLDQLIKDLRELKIFDRVHSGKSL